MDVQVVAHPPTTASAGARYPGNREPLAPNPLIKLPLGSVRPHGWIARQLTLMIDGMTGRLDELSKFLGEDNGWLGGDKPGWEEQPYWLRGVYDLAVLTGDERLKKTSDRWVEAVLASQDEEGYFGSPFHKHLRSRDGTQTVCDLWPHMVMLDVLIHHHEHSGDKRVIRFMQRFFAFCRELPESLFVAPVWPPDFDYPKPHVCRNRAGDMLAHLYWLYNRTGDGWLLPLAARFYRHVTPAEDEWLDHHIVNFTQRFAYPGLFWQQSREPTDRQRTDYWYDQHLGTWGQQARGIFGADERIRTGRVDPRHGFETCGMVEFARSFYLLGQAWGDPKWADRCEDVMLNHFAAAQTADLKGLHYLTASNLPQLDKSSNHDFCNERNRNNPQLFYSPHRYRCCQHNVAMGWPWYAQHLWLATADGGLAAWLYGPGEVTARVGDADDEVRLVAETNYPFRDRVTLRVESAGGSAFPLYLRVSGWCEGMTASVNGEPIDARPAPRTFLRIERRWRAGDRVELVLPMELALTTWPRTGAVTVDRGPLSYSVAIEEQWRRCGGTDDWPAWEVLPTSPWNYGLRIDPARAEQVRESLEVIERGEVAEQPWTLDAAPVELRVPARPIPTWTLNKGAVPPLQTSPIASDQPDETIRMVPLGCARLRMACLPVIKDSPTARPWRAENHHEAYGIPPKPHR